MTTAETCGSGSCGTGTCRSCGTCCSCETCWSCETCGEDGPGPGEPSKNEK
jgi:hypothetical protein